MTFRAIIPAHVCSTTSSAALGPCVENLTTPEIYGEAVRDAQMFLEGRQAELGGSIEERMNEAASSEQFELAANFDLLITVNQMQDKQRIATTDSDQLDVFGYPLRKRYGRSQSLSPARRKDCRPP